MSDVARFTRRASSGALLGLLLFTRAVAAQPNAAPAARPPTTTAPTAAATTPPRAVRPPAGPQGSAPSSSPTSPSEQASPNAEPANPHAGGQPQGPSDPHAGLGLGKGTSVPLASGSPFASTRHLMQADMARRGQEFQPKSMVSENAAIPPGTIAVLVLDPERNPIANQTVKLRVIRHSIAEGDKTTIQTANTDSQGRVGFPDQNTDSSFTYEVLFEKDGATYSSDSFRLKLDRGMIVGLHVFPVTKDMTETFLASRALYVITPQADVFQVHVLYRFHNTNPMTWKAEDFPIELPTSAKAFSPAQKTGDIRIREENGAVLLSGTFSPGQHEFSFGYHVPNQRDSTASVELTVPPHLIDARVVLEASSKMGLSVPGFDPPDRTTGQDGQLSLLAYRDFLKQKKSQQTMLTATITGLPTRGHGPLVAALIAATIALFGLALAVNRKDRPLSAVEESDLEEARDLLVRELVEVERAFQKREIGPKTHERTRRMLLDCLARLEASKTEPTAKSA